jgi:2-C-methyl-D-erythritol 2,4-cyclodiphosphate synthase
MSHMNILNLRTGIGYDTHKIKAGRPLMLCGVKVPCDFGLDGHSDADVMIHALMDALLGAAGLFDIGYYFPNTDNNFKNISSLKLLEKVKGLLADNNFKIINVDMVLISEKPKISPHVVEMKEKISRALQIDPQTVGIKATTNEKMGHLGRGEGMAAYATALIYKGSLK